MEYSAYVGFDVHQDRIAVARPGQEVPEYLGEITTIPR